jgi:hypothetical protein
VEPDRNIRENPEMKEEKLRDELYAAFKNRAMMYYHIFEELRAEIGDERAERIMKRAIRKRGLEIGRKFAPFGPTDLAGLKDAFVSAVPDGGRMFDPEVVGCDENRLEIHLRRCPLKDAWQEAGLDDTQVAKLCDIAAAVDTGTFEGAGFCFAAETWRPGQSGCCRLHITPGRQDFTGAR